MIEAPETSSPRAASSMSDPHNLQRFIDAQEAIYPLALAEIRAGRKRSHWMWYVFPQFHGLGFSSTSRHFAIKSLQEAEAYLRHPLLGPRLHECVDALLALEELSARQIFASPDDLKLRSCATLFAHLPGEGANFDRLLDKYFSGQRDPKTLDLIAATGFPENP